MNCSSFVIDEMRIRKVWTHKFSYDTIFKLLVVLGSISLEFSTSSYLNSFEI